MRNLLRRLDIYGDFWLRYLHWGTRNCPPIAEPVVLAGFTVMFFWLLTPARKAVSQNLRVILPGCTWLGAQLRTLRVFWTYAWTLDDLAHARGGDNIISWEIAGKAHLDELTECSTGALILTAHMGNYDIAAPVFADRFRRPIHMVRSPERQAESREYQDAHRSREQSTAFVIHYNEPGNMLGVELARQLSEGNIVAIQGDRVLFDVSAKPAVHDPAHVWNLPRGPFLLAAVSKVKIFPLFIIKAGYRHYRIEAHPAIEVQARDRQDREAAKERALDAWSGLLAEVVQRNWQQWFVFEPVFRGREGSATDEAKPVSSSPPKVDMRIDPPARGTQPRLGRASCCLGLWWWVFVFRQLTTLMGTGWVAQSVALLLSPAVTFLCLLVGVQVSALSATLLLRNRAEPSSRPRSYREPASRFLLSFSTLLAFAAAWSGTPFDRGLAGVWLMGLGIYAILYPRKRWQPGAATA